MAVYDLEEQDQIDDLKAWWARYGGTITRRRWCSAARRSPAMQGWRW